MDSDLLEKGRVETKEGEEGVHEGTIDDSAMQRLIGRARGRTAGRENRRRRKGTSTTSIRIIDEEVALRMNLVKGLTRGRMEKVLGRLLGILEDGAVAGRTTRPQGGKEAESLESGREK